MSDENRGVVGPASMRFRGQKLSELPLGMSEQAKQQMPAFIAQERKNRVDAIIARYPRVSIAYCESKIKESEENLVRFARARQGTIHDMDTYQGYLRNNDGRPPEEVEEEVMALSRAYVDEHRDNPDLVNEKGLPIPGTVPFQQLRKEIKTLNATRRPFDPDALWNQINLYRGNLERYDIATRKEADSILEVKEAMMLVRQRDIEITKAMSEPIAVE